MSLRRRFILVFATFAALITALGGYVSWRASSAALERELDDMSESEKWKVNEEDDEDEQDASGEIESPEDDEPSF